MPSSLLLRENQTIPLWQFSLWPLCGNLFQFALICLVLGGLNLPVRMREAMTVVEPVAFERKRENGTDKAGPSGNEDASSASLH